MDRILVYLLLLAVLTHPASAEKLAPPTNLASAEALFAEPSSPGRDKALAKWAAERSTLADLVYVLRRPAHVLGGAEGALVDAALKRTAVTREPLRRQLLARQALVDPAAARRSRDPLALAARRIQHPRASVFRVAAILPDSGDYRDYGLAVLEGLRAGLSALRPAGVPPIELEIHSSGDVQPERAVAAFDAVATRAGAVVGELLSGPTLVLATAARYAELPLLSPTATDEGIGAMAANVFQIGPSAYERGARLARVALAGGKPRVGLLLSTDAERGAFGRGFAETAERAGAGVVWRESYVAGSLNFSDEVRAMAASRVEVLLWDGEPREAEALVRQLARERLTVRLCGANALAPERHHGEIRVLLEGVQYVADDWVPSAALAARLDSLAVNRDDDHARGLAVRGYLAGRMLNAAVASGVLCPEELAARLASRAAADPYLRSHGFMDVSGEGVTLPVYTVRRGKAVGG